MFLSTKCIMSTLVLFSIIFSSVLAADSGFYTTDPTRGQINWLSQTTGTPSLVYDTLLSFPTALGINQNLDIYFANTAPSTLPWITHTRSQTENTLVYSTPESDTFAGSLIDGIAIDGSELFYLVANVPLTNEYADYPLIVSLDQSTSEASNVLSYSTNGFGFAYPTSLALDYENDHVYFTSMRTSNGSELLGEIYKLEYDGSDLENVWSASFAPSTHARIFSLQYSNHSLFFIDTSPQLDIKRFYIDYNTTSSVFASPSTISAKQIYIPQDSTTIYVLDTEGDIYVCLELSCDPITLRFSLGDTEVEDFAVDEATQTVYYISRGVSAVQFATQTSSPSVVSIGLSIDSQIWADTLRGRVYYGTNNVVNSISTQGSSWHFSRSYNDNIDILAGDLYTGNLIVSFQSTPGVWYSTGSSLSQLYTGAVTALTVKNRVVYFAAKDDNSILQCAIPTNGEACTATAVVSSVSGVTSVSVGMDGSTLYYALSNATYSVSLQAGQDPAVLFNTVNNIKPFAVASIDSSILFLDSPVTGGLFLRNCSYPLCVIPTLLASRPQSAAIGPRETGWIAVDAVNRFAYWSASTLRDEGGYYVAQTPLDTRSPTTYLSVGSDPITGLSWNANSSTLYVSLATNILLVHSNGNNETCTATVSSSKRNNVIGALAATQDSLYWSEFGSGAIYQCSDACDELTCTSSSFEPASGTRYNCARLQFLTATPTGDYIYNQYNCGGINKVSSAGDVTTLKTSDGFPITSLTIANDGRLVYALPYRATISVGTESAEGLSEVGTYFSGTGDISDLYVDDSKVPPLVYWVNKEGASLMVYDNQTFTDYNPLSVGSFVYVRTALVTVSPTFTRSVSASPAPSFVPESATPTPSASASIDASIAASVSASASASATATATATATASAAPTTSASATASQLLPGESPSSTPTPSSTVSDSATASESASASFDNSPSTTPTPPSVSNTPGIAELGEQDESPIIGRTGWEVIIFLSILITVLCIIPLSCLCWRKNTAAEMALSLRLPDGDEI